MTDGRLERALSEAIADLAGTSAPDYLDDILERTSRTRQRPWWTFPGRYPAMAPTLKFATAATVAFVLGISASMLILPQSSEPVTAPAAPERSPAVTPPTSDTDSDLTPFTDEFVARWEWNGEHPEWSSLPGQGSRYTYRVVESSDPRVDGAVFHTNQQLSIPGVTGWHGYIDVVNDGGAWTSEPLLSLFFEDGSGSVGTALFRGSGDYEGLTAIVEMALDADDLTMDVRGLITRWAVTDPPEVWPIE